MIFYIATVLIVVGIALYVAAPLTSGIVRHVKSRSADQQAAEHWRHEQALAVQGLRELEFDREMGKLSDADYESLRAALEGKALEAMTALEKIEESIRQRRLAALEKPRVSESAKAEEPTGAPPAQVQDAQPAAGADADRPPVTPQAVSSPSEPRWNAGADRRSGNGRRLRFCPQCGLRVTTTSNFCGECGAPLRAGERAAARSS